MALKERTNMKDIYNFIDISVYAASFEIYTPNIELLDKIYKFIREDGYGDEIKILHEDGGDTIEVKPKNMHDILYNLLWEFSDMYFRLF